MLRQVKIAVPGGGSDVIACDTTTCVDLQNSQAQLDISKMSPELAIHHHQPDPYNIASDKSVVRRHHHPHRRHHRPHREPASPYSGTREKQKKPQLASETNVCLEDEQDFSSDDDRHDSIYPATCNGRESGDVDVDEADDRHRALSELRGLTCPRSKVPEDVRLRINSRERQRMHDLNSALDGLRQVR